MASGNPANLPLHLSEVCARAKDPEEVRAARERAGASPRQLRCVAVSDHYAAAAYEDPVTGERRFVPDKVLYMHGGLVAFELSGDSPTPSGPAGVTVEAVPSGGQDGG